LDSPEQTLAVVFGRPSLRRARGALLAIRKVAAEDMKTGG